MGAHTCCACGGSSVEIIEKGAMLAGVVEEGSNLMEASYSETGDSIVSQVAIYDKQGNLKQTVTGDMTLGVMQEIIIESSARAESIAAAEELIRKNGLKRSGTVTNLGNAQCIAGNSVLIYESFTGLYGSFSSHLTTIVGKTVYIPISLPLRGKPQWMQRQRVKHCRLAKLPPVAQHPIAPMITCIIETERRMEVHEQWMTKTHM